MDGNLIESKKVVFIVGAARSGTTWLRSLMQQSEHVACVSNETHLFNHYVQPSFQAWDALEGHITGIRHLIPENEFHGWVNDLVRRCLQRIADTNPEAPLILEKTPNHSDCGDAIIRCLPHSYFIHIIRDPRACVASLRAASGSWGSAWAPRRLKDGCSMWKRRVARAQSIATLTSRYREVQYESLHADTPGKLLSLFDWLETPISRQQAEAFAAGCSLDTLRTEATRDSEFVNAADPSEFYRRGEIDSWRQELPNAEIALVEHLTRKQMAELGYEPVAGRRDRVIAKARLRAYRASVRVEAAAHGLSERMKP